ncbi:tyrosine-type recombinase/integrase [Marinobacter salarius]|uniref:tyrosine-type recombinase/integrase n=1 Tax=Marinobacter salarius TaxID=1420917 RepID=UPI001D0DAD21|nr:tyrosine-type recombinase/integrase [Marinobacter salarius]
MPVAPELVKEIQEHLKQHGSLSFSLSAFRRALDKSDIALPPGQGNHVLRHTSASHFVMNGGDILSLQKILGYSSIGMRMRYAHLSDAHFNIACEKGPRFYLYACTNSNGVYTKAISRCQLSGACRKISRA